MQSSDFDAMTAMELRGRIARREVSPVEATRRALEKAECYRLTYSRLDHAVARLIELCR